MLLEKTFSKGITHDDRRHMVIVIVCSGSARAYGNEPESCLGRVFNFKLDSYAVVKDVHCTHACTYLNLKTWPRFRPVSLSSSMVCS